MDLADSVADRGWVEVSKFPSVKISQGKDGRQKAALWIRYWDVTL